MIATKRRSIAAKMLATPSKKKLPAKVTAVPSVAPAPTKNEDSSAEPDLTSPRRRQSRSLEPKSLTAVKPATEKAVAHQNLAAPQAGFPGTEASKIYLAQGM